MRGSAATRRTKQIVEALLEFARSGAPRSQDRSCNVAEVFHGLQSEFSKAAEEAGIALTLDGPAIYVACDTGVLTSILSNLVRNALKYMGPSQERRVEVRAIGETSTVLFEVHDTGPGIPSSLKERMFEPYVRGDDSGSGLGLGLATVKRLVEGHGGAVGVVSRPAHGSLFWCRLPRVVPIAQPTLERRRSTRLKAKLEAELAAGSRWISARIINISRGGLLARVAGVVPQKGMLTVKLAAKNPIVGEGYVRRSAEITGEQEIAIEFRDDADFVASLDQLLVESKLNNKV
jgi:two-component sensor histidine kinase